MQSKLKAAGKDKKEQGRFSPTENDSMKIKKVEVFKTMLMRSRSRGGLVVTVKTGDTKGGGLHNAAYLTLIDDRGNRSKEMCLQGCCFTVFKKGHTDTFQFGEAVKIGRLCKIEFVRRDVTNRRNYVEWFIETIEVRRFSGEDFEDFIFPCHRWIRNMQPLILRTFDSTLPQFDVETEQRETELFWKRTMYRYYRRRAGIPPQISFCPKEEVFSCNHQWDIIVKRSSLVSKYNLPDFSSEPWMSFNDFDEVFDRKLGKPTGRDYWRDDVHFARQRLCGCNPTLIRLCSKIPDNLAVTSGMLEPFLEGQTLEEALTARRIFIVNLEILSRLNLDEPRKVVSPMALFFLSPAKSYLFPIAIQLFQERGDNNPVFLPSDPWYTWMLAKMWFNNADAQYHRACVLLGYTHLFLEAVSIATHRQLSPSHPVFRLLAPYLRHVIPVNCFEVNELLAPGSWIDNTTSLGAKGTVELIAFGWSEWRMDVQGTLPQDLEERGVLDPSVLPDYPYRDDGLLLYEAIYRYVSSVIEARYDTEDSLVEDYELQAWRLELVADGNPGCGIKGVPGDGKFDTAKQLSQTLSSILFASTVGHAAANVPQYDEYAYLPNYPAILTGFPPREKKWRDEKDLLACLPPKNISMDILVIAKLLSERHSNGLADFHAWYQHDPIAKKAISSIDFMSN
ncbi:polyunsaturated fatty acid lipoxygenase ALOX15B-like isoform X3 [Acropora millepora]|uniref:polyunsaturated fatty acid lipoxygenase ALOX15B-like isoform X3 n=1 Tax=Acropora millepora TaxID=45264 RepID=UPI001CF2552A|nr:polyunsaturated fatty acid lipoxygenase ALOX15B-like isoform X3 [Acropora millepora]